MNADYWHFSSPVECIRLGIEACSWIGTPFRARHAVKGVGVDCAHFVGEVYFALGIVPRFEFPAYSLDEGSHSKADTGKAIEAIRATGRFYENAIGPDDCRPPAEFIIGDILCFNLGRVEHHLAIAVGASKMIHALAGCGVIEESTDQRRYKGRLTRLFRAYKIGRQPS